MFLLYVAQHKLNIHNDLDSCETDLVSVDDVRLASNVIECFERTLESNEPIDPRRGMIYMVCKARVHVTERQFSKAMILLNEATKLAEEGAHYINESRNIIEFTNKLLLRNQTV
jgi:hypothetical protein